MSGAILTRGFVLTVCYRHGDRAEACVANQGFWDLSGAEADKALAAKRADKEIEIAQPEGGCWKDRTVRLVPVVVVKARGKVTAISRLKDGGAGASVLDQRGAWFVEVNREGGALVARAFADDAEIEIVSIDGEPDMVRRVS